MDLGTLPNIRNQTRRARGRESLVEFVKLYFPMRPRLTAAQKQLLERHEEAIKLGGHFLNRVRHGQGTSSAVVEAVAWGLLNGHLRHAMVVGPTGLSSMHILDQIKAEIEMNLAIRDDFPEICEPVVAGARSSAHYSVQRFEGELTHVIWSRKKIALPWIPGRGAYGPVVESIGIHGAIMGHSHRLPDGSMTRPDTVIVDGHQTADSAKSHHLSARRIEIVCHDLPRLGFVGQGFAMVVNEPEDYPSVKDFADRMTMPEWL